MTMEQSISSLVGLEATEIDSREATGPFSQKYNAILASANHAIPHQTRTGQQHRLCSGVHNRYRT
jgi:hypothetical protein